MNWKDSLVASTDSQKKCVFVLGPTASGKSAWALEQAQRTGGSVVNIDSVQFYSGLLIGSAAPTEDEKRQVPHYLYSYVQAPVEMTAALFLQDFYELLKRPDLAFPLYIVGGTGFYIQALEKGMFNIEPVPPEVRSLIEAELQQSGAEPLYAELKKHDPDSKIHINDHFRLVRALEIIRHTGAIPSRLKEQPENNKNGLTLPSIKVGFDFDKAVYLDRVQSRTEKMIRDGIVDEVRNFCDRGFAEWAPLQSVGYREAMQFLQQNQSLQWLQENIVTSTMQLIKKQKTWFKRDQTILWSTGDKQSSDLLRPKLDQFLSKV